MSPEDVEHFFEQERRDAKSSTLGAYFRKMVAPAKQPNFFQQVSISQNLHFRQKSDKYLAWTKFHPKITDKSALCT
jgi:hypothetical protein